MTILSKWIGSKTDLFPQTQRVFGEEWTATDPKNARAGLFGNDPQQLLIVAGTGEYLVDAILFHGAHTILERLSPNTKID